MVSFSSDCLKVYRLVCGSITGLICDTSKSSAVEAFCRLHTLYPSQVVVLYSYPLCAS